MSNLSINSTAKTPVVNFNGETGCIEITGKSIPENAFDFFQPLSEWVDNYVKSPATETNIHINLEYFNTSSAKCMLGILKQFEPIQESGRKVLVQWYYQSNDEEMMESGNDYQSVVNVPFKLVPIN
jgi:hypothetical protein